MMINCQHLSPNHRRTTSCPTCKGVVELKVFPCSIHNECTIDRQITGISCCRTCKERKPLMRKIWHSNTDDPIEAGGHPLASMEIVRKTEFIPPQAEGTGVVIVGGGKYWPGIHVAIEMLKRCGHDLPVEVWYNSKRGETVGPVPPNVRLIDVANETNARCLNGWENKLWAIANSRFEKLLFLDADAYTVQNVQPYFDLLDKHPFIFWEDLQRCEVNYKLETEKIPEAVQGGQFFVNRKTAWRAICIANWMGQHSHFFFKHMFGDQDTWRYALLEAPGYLSLGRCPWRGVAFLCGQPPVIVHRCRGKLFTLRDRPANQPLISNPQYYLPREDEVFDIFRQVAGDADHQESFNHIYQKGVWGVPESPAEFIQYAQSVIDETDGTVVDLGFGNGDIGMSLQVNSYRGFDIFKANVDKRPPVPRKTFEHLDFFKNPELIPSAGVLLLKDVLIHWPNEMVRQFLKYLSSSRRWGRIIICHDRHQRYDDQDTYLGGYRALSHLKRPMNEFPFKHVKDYLHKSIYELM